MIDRFHTHRKIILIIALGILLLGAVTAAYFVWRSREAQWTTFSQTDPAFIFEYNTQFFASRDIPSEEEQTKSHTVFRATERSSDLPSALLTVRYEEGLRLVTSLTRQDPIAMLLSNADKAFPTRYKDYKKLTERTFALDEHDAAEILLTYEGGTGETVKQRFLVVAYDADRAVYMAVQAKEADFADLNKRYFERMFNSLAFPADS